MTQNETPQNSLVFWNLLGEKWQNWSKSMVNTCFCSGNSVIVLSLFLCAKCKEATFSNFLKGKLD